MVYGEKGMKKLAIIYGAVQLGYVLIKSLFYHNTVIYRCPECSLVLKRNVVSCIRCGTVLDWGGV